MLILKGHDGPVRCVAYSPDGRWLASGSEDRTVRRWDLTGGTAGSILTTMDEGIEALAFAPDGETFAVGMTDGSVELFHPDDTSNTVAVEYPGTEPVRCLAYSPDGRYIAGCGWDHQAAIWFADTLLDSNVWQEEGEHLAAVAFEPKGAFVLAGGSVAIHRIPVERDRTCWRTEHQHAPIMSLAVSANGRLTATGHADGGVHLWKASSGERLATLRGHTWTVYAVAFTPDGRTLLSGGADGTVRLWDVASGRERRAYQWHKRWVTCAALSPDGMTAAAGSDDTTIVVWDVDE